MEKEENFGDNPFQPKWEVFFKSVYLKEIQRLVEKYPEKRSLEIDFKKIEEFDFELADELIANPDYLLSGAEDAIKEIDVPALELEDFSPHIRVFNLPKDSMPILRNISSNHLSKLISVEGIVKQMTDVLPKLKMATWECRHCGNTYKILQDKQKEKKPVICECKHREFVLIEEQSNFMDYQKIQIQEPLDLLKGSEQATNLDVYVSDDLVNKVAPGDRTKITGVLRLVPPKEKKIIYGRYLEAIHLEETAKEYEEVEITPEEEEQIKEMAANPKIYDILTESIAPAIYGHETIKEAVALQLFGGIKKELPNEQKIRGNVHVLVIGDPGTAKCVSGETKVLLANGCNYKISELVENKITNKSNLLKDGFYDNAKYSLPLMNYDGIQKTGIASRVWKRKPTEMYLIKTSLGNKIKVTNTHPLFVCEKGKVKAKKTQELKKGEFIASPRIINISGKKQKLKKIKKGKTNATHIKLPEEVNAEFARFIGYMLAEGYTQQTNSTKQIRFVNIDKEVLNDFKFCTKKLFEKKTYERKRNNLIEIILDSIELGKFLDKNVPELMQNSKKRDIPEKIMKSKLPIVNEFLKAFFETESSPAKRSRTIEIVSASEKLIDNLQILLLRNEIVSKKKEIMNIATNSKTKEKRKYFKIVFEGKFAKKFVEKIGFITKRKQKISKKFLLNKKINTNIDVIPNLATELKTIRNYLGLYQKEMNVIRSTYEHYEKGDRNPSREQLKKISQCTLKKYLKSNKRNAEIEDKILNISKLSQSDIFWEKIELIEKIKSDEWVYDLEVNETHNFITNLVFSHNSQLLQAANKIAPKSVYVSGKSSTGAGITASAVKDDFGEGGWTLKAGALVLASGGAAFIDEFDKMETEDRSSMHEAMEQGMVSVAKAGIVTRFKTDTSILAAANPKYSRFDPFQPFIEQINLPPTLISRFDLFFMLRDVLDKTKDLEIANHILQTHRVGEIMRQQKHRKTKKSDEEVEEMKEKITPKIDSEMLKKYVAYARQKIFPAMTKKAVETISSFYVDLRESGRKEGAYAATHRQLEGLVRLSEASARVRLSDKVTEEDALRAIKLFKTSMQELVTDPETGKIDVDIITSGRTHTQLNNLKTILSIIKSKAQETDMIPIEELIEEAKTQGIESETVRETITKLEKAGDIYKPRHGFVKPTQK